MQGETDGSGGSGRLGNTKRPNASKRWCFTLNNWSQKELDTVLQNLSLAPENRYCIGKEVGEKGTPHLQGYIEFANKCRPLEIKGMDVAKRIHWEKCKGNKEANINYCIKEGDYITNFKIKKPLKCLKEEQLYNWQKEIIEIIKKDPDDRKIYWYWEEKGNMGKTTFAKYLTIKYDAVPIEGKKNDILYCAAEHESDIYIFDLERSMEEFISYGAMEKIKNGYYMCSKYESKPITRNPPHIFCFANFPPDKSKLSLDRWVIVKL